MSATFNAFPASDVEALVRLAKHTPWSPFNTRAYAAAASRLQMTPYSLVTQDEQGIVDGCLGLLSSGSTPRLELPSLPRLQDPPTFWHGVRDFCAGHEVTDLVVDTFASEVACLPDFSRRSSYRPRCEYVIDLDEGFENRIARDHRYNARKAMRAGISVTRTHDVDACETHLRLMRQSTNRRSARGETVDVPVDGSLHAAILEADAGELLQACLDGRVLSSILVLRGEAAAYYHSGGTRPEGMKAGASQFLLFETARQLAAEGVEVFNLGGADAASEGLRTFKLRFGAREVPLAAATYFMIPGYQRTVRRLIRRLGRVPGSLRKLTR